MRGGPDDRYRRHREEPIPSASPLDLIGTIYLQNAKEHIFDAVWEYNQNIKN